MILGMRDNAVKSFMFGLDDKISDFMRQEEPFTLESAIQIAWSYETNLILRDKLFRRSEKSHDLIQLKIQDRNYKRRTITTQDRGRETKSADVECHDWGRLRHISESWDKDPQKCNKCCKLGNILRYCFKRPRYGLCECCHIPGRTINYCKKKKRAEFQNQTENLNSNIVQQEDALLSDPRSTRLPNPRAGESAF